MGNYNQDVLSEYTQLGAHLDPPNAPSISQHSVAKPLTGSEDDRVRT